MSKPAPGLRPGLVVEIAVPRLDRSIYFVADAATAVLAARRGIPRGWIWTQADLRELQRQHVGLEGACNIADMRGTLDGVLVLPQSRLFEEGS